MAESGQDPQGFYVAVDMQESDAFSTPSKSLMLAKSSEASFPLAQLQRGGGTRTRSERTDQPKKSFNPCLSTFRNDRHGALHRALVNSRPRGMSPSKTELSPSIRMAMASPCLIAGERAFIGRRPGARAPACPRSAQKDCVLPWPPAATGR